MQAMATKTMSEDLAKTVSASGDLTKWFAETGHSLVYVGVDAADSSTGVFLINYGSQQNYEMVEDKSEELLPELEAAVFLLSSSAFGLCNYFLCFMRVELSPPSRAWLIQRTATTIPGSRNPRPP